MLNCWCCAWLLDNNDSKWQETRLWSLRHWSPLSLTSLIEDDGISTAPQLHSSTAPSTAPHLAAPAPASWAGHRPQLARVQPRRSQVSVYCHPSHLRPGRPSTPAPRTLLGSRRAEWSCSQLWTKWSWGNKDVLNRSGFVQFYEYCCLYNIMWGSRCSKVIMKVFLTLW